MIPNNDASCKSVCSLSSLANNNLLFNSSEFSFSNAHSQSSYNTCELPINATSQAVYSLSALANVNLSSKPSAVTVSLTHCHSFCNYSSLPYSAALCQAVLSLIFLAKNKFLFQSSSVNTCLAHSPNFVK